MFNGYPVCPALTSLVLLASLASAPSPPPHPRGCSDIRRLYSPRILRELRARLVLAYAESHARRAELAEGYIEGKVPEEEIFREVDRIAVPEDVSPKVRRIWRDVVKSCLEHGPERDQVPSATEAGTFRRPYLN